MNYLEENNLAVVPVGEYNESYRKPEESKSVRKKYLEKRALVLREALSKSDNDLDSFIDQIKDVNFRATKDEALFACALEWMKQNLSENIQISDLADALQVSVRKVQRLFRFFMGKPFTTIFWEMRLSEAKCLLKDLRLSIGDVAVKIGLKDHAYFTYLFRRATNMTPSQYREQHISLNMMI
jgi:AraC-like DNA-binding protein